MGKYRNLSSTFFLLILHAAGAGFFANQSNAVIVYEHMTIRTGTVIKHDFINPHDQLQLSVNAGHGKIDTWN